MKYKIKYLIKKDYCNILDVHSSKVIIKRIYNINNCEFKNDCFEVKIKLIDYLYKIFINFISFYYEYPRYCIEVEYYGKSYFGINEKHLEKFKNRYNQLNLKIQHLNLYFNISTGFGYYTDKIDHILNNIKLIKEVMIEEIVG